MKLLKVHNRDKTFFYFVPLLLLLGACLLHSVSVPYSDYAGYYFGSRELLQGNYRNAYDMQSLNFLIAAQGYKGIFVSYAPFPPFTSLVFAPFTAFPMNLSKVLFDCCSCVLFLFTLFRSYRFFSIPAYILLLIPVIFFIPIVNNIFFGQSYLLLSCLLLEGYMAYKQQKPVLSSLLWAIAILFKLFPVLILPFLLIRKKYKNALYLSAACLVLLIPSLWLNGFHAWKFYVSEIMPKINNGELNDPFTSAFQSAFMLLKKVFLSDELLNPRPVFNNYYLFVITIALFRAFLISSCVALTFWKKNDDFISFAAWMAASMLISPNGSSYSLILLLVPLLALAKPADPPMPKKAFVVPLAIVLLSAACIIPVQHFSSFPVWGQFPRLYLLLLFFGLLLQSKKVLNVRLFLIFFVLFAAPGIFSNTPRKDASSYLLEKEEHIFIYDYTIKNNELVYYYWDDSGVNETVTDYSVHSSADEGLAIQGNQIWYKGKKITASADWKRKPLLINGEYIIYLSDKNRGVGFYTLRKLKLDTVMQDDKGAPAPSR